MLDDDNDSIMETPFNNSGRSVVRTQSSLKDELEERYVL